MADFNTLLKQAEGRFDIAADGTQPGVDSASADLALFNLHSKRASTRGSLGLVHFRPQDIEPLLDQASAILEKALSDRTRWQSAGEKFANLKLDIYNSGRLVAISLAEEQDGRFDVDHFVTEGTQNANNAKISAAVQQKTELDALVTMLDPQNLSVSVNRAVITEYIRAMYSTEFGANVKYPNGGYTTSDKVANADQDLTKAQATEDLTKQAHSANASSQQVAGEIAGAQAMQVGLQKQADWAQKNAAYLRQRADTARQTLQMKVAMAAMTALLDFHAQMNSAQTMYLQGVWDAYLRLQAITIGLARYYNYPSPDNDPLPEFSDDPASFDLILAWSRRAARWLAAFTRRTNNYVYTVSVKQITGDQWDPGKAHASWQFELPLGAFAADERHIRVRGVTAWADNDRGKIWQVILTPPATTKVQYESGRISDSFQQASPACRVGRVVSRGKVVVPEISGLTALYNTSPVGTWTADLRDAISPQEVPKTLPDDIQIDIYLSVLTVHE